MKRTSKGGWNRTWRWMNEGMEKRVWEKAAGKPRCRERRRLFFWCQIKTLEALVKRFRNLDVPSGAEGFGVACPRGFSAKKQNGALILVFMAGECRVWSRFRDGPCALTSGFGGWNSIRLNNGGKSSGALSRRGWIRLRVVRKGFWLCWPAMVNAHLLSTRLETRAEELIRWERKRKRQIWIRRENEWMGEASEMSVGPISSCMN